MFFVSGWDLAFFFLLEQIGNVEDFPSSCFDWNRLGLFLCRGHSLLFKEMPRDEWIPFCVLLNIYMHSHRETPHAKHALIFDFFTRDSFFSRVGIEHRGIDVLESPV